MVSIKLKNIQDTKDFFFFFSKVRVTHPPIKDKHTYFTLTSALLSSNINTENRLINGPALGLCQNVH